MTTLTENAKQDWIEVITRGATIFLNLQETLQINPSRSQWEVAFENQVWSGIPANVTEAIWTNSQAVAIQFDRLSRSAPLLTVVENTTNWEQIEKLAYYVLPAVPPVKAENQPEMEIEKEPETTEPKPKNDVKCSADSNGVQANEKVSKTNGKFTLIVAGTLFVGSCVFPPWQQTADLNGSSGFHSRKPAGYSLIFNPPAPETSAPVYGVQVDYSRLLIEWAAIGVATGVILFLRQGKRGSDSSSSIF